MSKFIHSIKYYVDIFLERYARIRIIRLQPGKGFESDRYPYQKDLFNFNISRTDKVLDIGSGGIPFPLATHLADLYTDTTSHRVEKIVKDDRPFIVCDIEKMPFSDKYFDFVYCSHLLEHVQNPALACGELMRIGKRGYIETPTKTTDIFFNFVNLKDHHKWHIELIGQTLFFMEWPERTDLGTTYFFEQYHSIWKNHFQDVVRNNRKLFFNMLLWEKSFEFVVIDKSGKIISKSSNCEITGA